MENNDYYEPTIKTIRNDISKVEYDINIYGNLMITDKEKQSIKVVEVPSIKKLFNEKQQLVSFLEDKIKENLLNKEYTYSGNFWFYKGKEEACQEVLDFVNKDDK